MAVRNRVCGPTQSGITALTPRCTKGGCKLDGGQRMPGAGLSCRRSRKAPLRKPTFQPYWGKPAVRNDREDRGNVGIIRSPLRASILPDYIGANGRHSDVCTVQALARRTRPVRLPAAIASVRMSMPEGQLLVAA